MVPTVGGCLSDDRWLCSWCRHTVCTHKLVLRVAFGHSCSPLACSLYHIKTVNIQQPHVRIICSCCRREIWRCTYKLKKVRLCRRERRSTVMLFKFKIHNTSMFFFCFPLLCVCSHIGGVQHTLDAYYIHHCTYFQLQCIKWCYVKNT